MKKLMIFIIMFFFLCCLNADAAEITFDFEKDNEGWDIPVWALEQGNCVGESVETSSEISFQNDKALKVSCDFPGDVWTSAVVEFRGDVDLSDYKTISANIFLPEDAKGDLFRARIILMAGPWWWIEMRQPVMLKRGKWTKVEAKLDVNAANELLYWKRKSGKKSGLVANIDNVRKIIVRVEYNVDIMNKGPKYKGPIYIDDIEIK